MKIEYMKSDITKISDGFIFESINKFLENNTPIEKKLIHKFRVLGKRNKLQNEKLIQVISSGRKKLKDLEQKIQEIKLEADSKLKNLKNSLK